MLWINGGIHDPIGLDYRTDDTLCAPRIHELSQQYRDLVKPLFVSLRGEEFILWRPIAQRLVDCAADLLEARDYAALRCEFLPVKSTDSERLAAYKRYLFDIARTRAAAYRSILKEDLTPKVFAVARSVVSRRIYCAAKGIPLELTDAARAPPPRPTPRPFAAFTSVPVPPARAQLNGVRDVAGRTTTSSGSLAPVLRASGSPSSSPPPSHRAAAPLATSEPPRLHNGVESITSPATTGTAPRSRAPSMCGIAPLLPDPKLSQQTSSASRVEPTGTDADLRPRDEPVPPRVVALPPSPPGPVSSSNELPEWRRTLRPRAPSHQRRRRRRRGRHHAGTESLPTGASCPVPATSPARGGNHRGSRRRSSFKSTGPVAGSMEPCAERRGSSLSEFAARAPPLKSSSATVIEPYVSRREHSLSRSRHHPHSAVHGQGDKIATSRAQKRARSFASAAPSPSRSPRRGRSRKRRSRRRSRTSSPTHPTCASDEVSKGLATGVYAMRIAVAYMLRLRRELQLVGEVKEV